MNLGYDKALYLLPFDHRQSYVTEMFHFEPPLDAPSQRGYVTALSVERSGTEEFEFEYGVDFASHIEAFDSTFAKVLVRYNPDGDPALNRRQVGRLRELSEYCRRSQRRFMFELLVPPTDDQIVCAGGNKGVFDRPAAGPDHRRCGDSSAPSA